VQKLNLQTLKLTPTAKKSLLAAALLLPLCIWAALRPSCVGATPPAEEAMPATSLPAVPLEQAGDAGLTPPAIFSTTATLIFTTVPSTAHASVTWGKKKLGRIEPGKPLVVVRPRDSGPLDVTVRAENYLPVHTRAYTFNDARISVKLTRPDAMNTLLGYRMPVDAGVEPNLDEEPAAEGPAMPTPLW
jgi:hypothetical protein